MSESFIHRFQPGSVTGAAPLLLLHGTGGDENDLLPLGAALSPGAALLSPRGQVLEHGMPRFFRRLAEGVFDEDDVRRRAAELAAFVTETGQRYGLAAPIAVGFSNGANIAAALLLTHPGVLSGAVLLRAMVPLSEPPAVDLQGTPVLILYGVDSQALTMTLSSPGAATGLEVDVSRRAKKSFHDVKPQCLARGSCW